MENKEEQKNIDKEIVDLVVARLETIPSNVNLSVGDEGSFTIDELIEKVKSGDEIGKKVIELHLNFLRSLGNLPLEENVSTNN